ncbi:hypothetical protein PHLCEN_2v4950 [Hermanssonia centrifuga]|uniref:Uracil-DNA glycosylase-like domain-containing protein n=1 Tax=Hermanssonia centrifuga TaxID=98765 RepID=A0A2R6PCC7_9APHY|nr:hypothetical protein PHLCEN_2v4950 [Hermanssonia centrifuga]
MSDSTTTDNIVYLEDLVAPSSSSPRVKESNEVATVVKKGTVVTAPGKNQSTTSTSLKRQRTLADMFSGSSATKSAQPGAKKIKLDHAAGSPSSGLSGSKSLNSIPFSLSGFVSSLSDEEKQLLALECETIGKSWQVLSSLARLRTRVRGADRAFRLKVLNDEIRKPYFIKLKRFLWDQGVKGPDDSAKSLKIYPARELCHQRRIVATLTELYTARNIYSWSNLTPLGRVKVVIIGQDPYHGPNQAHGMRGYDSASPFPKANLTTWAENGVLLLNTCLTVKAAEAGSHSGKGWEEFTDKVVDVVDRYGGANLAANGSDLGGRGRGIVFLAWGAWAMKRVAKLDKKKHLILTSAVSDVD